LVFLAVVVLLIVFGPGMIKYLFEVKKVEIGDFIKISFTSFDEIWSTIYMALGVGGRA
jgi:hypothetical protein